MLSAVWMVRRGRRKTQYIVFRNHTTDESWYVNRPLWHALRPRFSLLLLFVLSLLTLRAVNFYGVVPQEYVAQIDDNIGKTIALATVAWLLMLALATRWRFWRFKKTYGKRLCDALDSRASAALQNRFVTPAS